MVGRIWRVSKTPLTLLFLLGILVLAGRWGYAAVTAPLPPPYVPPCLPMAVENSTLQSNQISVKVMNASTKRGKAAEISRQLKTRGFNVSQVGNAETREAKSAIIGVAPDSPEVVLVEQQFVGFEVRGDGRVDHSVEVLIGADYESMAVDTPTSIEVPGETVCLPPTPTAVA